MWYFISLMSQFPDAEATVAYLQLTRCVIDSYFNKQLHPLARIERHGMLYFLLDTGVGGC